ncbi:unnamed protein product, partial [Laminaria digitata]
RGRQGRRADSPRHAASGGRSSSSRPRPGGAAGSRVLSRGCSPASSRGRSRSTSSRRGDRRGGAPVFDPTAYQREREQRLSR